MTIKIAFWNGEGCEDMLENTDLSCNESAKLFPPLKLHRRPCSGRKQRRRTFPKVQRKGRQVHEWQMPWRTRVAAVQKAYERWSSPGPSHGWPCPLADTDTELLNTFCLLLSVVLHITRLPPWYCSWVHGHFISEIPASGISSAAVEIIIIHRHVSHPYQHCLWSNGGETRTCVRLTWYQLVSTAVVSLRKLHIFSSAHAYDIWEGLCGWNLKKQSKHLSCSYKFMFGDKLVKIYGKLLKYT